MLNFIKLNAMKQLTTIAATLIVLFFVQCSSNSSDPAPSPPKPVAESIKDADGNVYTTITIGGQVWLLENLKTTKFLNGDDIPGNIPDGYYSWATVIDARKICPKGYRPPTDLDFNAMVSFYGGTSEVSMIRKGFRPAFLGYYNSEGFTVFLNDWGYFWTTSESSAQGSWAWLMHATEPAVKAASKKANGLCVRCIKD